MPAILERIKSRVRGRSRSRESNVLPDSPKTSEDAVPKTPTIPSQYQNLSRPSLENSAFHVTTARGVRKSIDGDPFQQRVAESNNSPTSLRKKDVDVTKKDERAAETAPNRTSSRIVISNRPQSQPSGQKGTTVNDPVVAKNGVESHTTEGALAPKRAEAGSVKKSHVELDPVEPSLIDNNAKVPAVPAAARESAVTPVTRKIPNTSSVRDSSEVQSSTTAAQNRRPSTSENIQRKPLPSTSERKLPVARKPLPSPRNGTIQLDNSDTSRMESQKAKEVALAGGHLRLPSGFNMNNTEQTHVTEMQRPAVTHETIIKERTEIFQEAITRDIHYHHYYTYVQPIKVVEVLPPKHYFLNLETGEKTEIPAPSGWSMPTSMIPVSPDYNVVKGWTRHYLVDEEHPSGILEAPPLKHEADVNNLREAAQEQTV